MDIKKLNIGFYSEGKYFIDSNDVVHSSDIFLTFFQKIFKERKINLIGRLSTKKFNPSHYLDNNWSLIPLTFYNSIFKLLLVFPCYILKNIKKINFFIENVDVLFISPSGPLSVFILNKIKIKNKKVVLFIRQDTRKLISIKNNNNFVAKILANLIETYIEKFVQNYSNATVFTFGGEIYKRYLGLSSSTFSIADSRYNNSDILSINDIKDKSYTKLKLLYVGRLAPGKGLEFLIKCLSKINHFEFTLTVVGDGIIKEDLIQLVKKHNLTNKIKFKGYIHFSKNLLNEYSSHDIFIMPSFSEGLPQVVFEAMSRGIVVVATNVGGIPDQIQNKVNGFLFDPGEENQLLKILNEIVLNQMNLIEIRKNALAVAEKYSFQSQRDFIIKKINLK